MDPTAVLADRALREAEAAATQEALSPREAAWAGRAQADLAGPSARTLDDDGGGAAAREVDFTRVAVAAKPQKSPITINGIFCSSNEATSEASCGEYLDESKGVSCGADFRSDYACSNDPDAVPPDADASAGGFFFCSNSSAILDTAPPQQQGDIDAEHDAEHDEQRDAVPPMLDSDDLDNRRRMSHMVQALSRRGSSFYTNELEEFDDVVPLVDSDGAAVDDLFND